VEKIIFRHALFSAFSLESNALKGLLWLARWPAGLLPQKLGRGST